MVNWLQRQLTKGNNGMDDIVQIIRSKLPAVGAVVLYEEVLLSVQTQGKNDQLLPAAIYQLKADGFLRKEVGRREGDVTPKYRLVRIGA